MAIAPASSRAPTWTPPWAPSWGLAVLALLAALALLVRPAGALALPAPALPALDVPTMDGPRADSAGPGPSGADQTGPDQAVQADQSLADWTIADWSSADPDAASWSLDDWSAAELSLADWDAAGPTAASESAAGVADASGPAVVTPAPAAGANTGATPLEASAVEACPGAASGGSPESLPEARPETAPAAGDVPESSSGASPEAAASASSAANPGPAPDPSRWWTLNPENPAWPEPGPVAAPAPGAARGEAALSASRVTIRLTDTDPPVVAEADQLFHDQADGSLKLVGRVRLSRADEVITGDRAFWHEPTRTAEISGNVTLTTADFTARAARAAVNMDLRLAKIYDGQAFFPERHYYVEGDVIERQGPETLYINEAALTTCDGTEPSWSLRAENLLVNRGGVATASGVSFNTKWFPLFYVPWFMVPVQNQRQTGFLIPTAGHSSRDGFSVATPFFWEIAEDLDLTLVPFYRSERGLAMTAEGRYNLDSGQGIWLATYLRDSQNNIYEFKNPGGGTRDSRDLYWIRTQNTWLVRGWDVNLDLDLVSDPLFLYAFRHDVDGFHYSQGIFARHFGRSVNEELDASRLSTLFAQKASRDTYLRAALTYTDNLYRHGNVDTLQNLPSLVFNLVSRPLIAPGLDSVFGPGAWPRLSLDAQYDFFTRRSDAMSSVTETGHRLRVAPSLFYNHSFGGLLALKLDAGGRLAAYLPSGRRPSSSGLEPHSSFESSLSGNLLAELSTTLQKVYRTGPGSAVATLHQVTPVVSLEIVEAPSQETLPFFDYLDRRLNRRTLRYGLRNTITTKTPVTGPDGATLRHDYRQILKFGIYSSYEFASNIDWAQRGWARYYTTGYFDRGVGPLEIEIESDFQPGMSARLISSLDGRTGKFTRHEISMSLADPRGDSLSLIYDYDNPSLKQGPALESNISQIRGDAVVNIANGWSASFSTRYDFTRDSQLETRVSIEYSAQCYGLALIYSDSDDDRRVGLVVDLLGLGSFGTPTTRLSSSPAADDD